MAEDFPEFNPDAPATPVFPEFDPSKSHETSESAPPEDVSAGMAMRGIPVLGAYVPQAEAAIRAAAHPLTGVGEKGETYSERYAKNLPKRQADYAKAESDSPIASTALQVAGGAAVLAPLGATALGARALGGVGTLGQRVGAGMASSAGISAVDALARGEDPTTAGAVGAGIGAALPLVGAAAGRIGRASRGFAGAPTADELAPVVDHGYTALRNAGVEFNPGSVNRAVRTIAANSDLHPELTPKTLRLLAQTQAETTPQAPGAMSALTGVQPPARLGQSFDDLDTLRKRLGAVARDYSNPTEQLAARNAMGQIDDFIANVTPADVLRGNASQIGAMAREARGNAAAEFRLRAMNALRQRAEDQAGSHASGMNVENAYRQQLRAFIRPSNKGISPAMKEGFTPQEIDQMRVATRGTSFPNMLRLVSNMLGGGHGIMAGAGLVTSYETGDPRYAMAVGAGLAGRQASNAMMRSRADRLARMTAARSPLAGVMNTGGPMGPPLNLGSAQAGAIGAGTNVEGGKPERKEKKSIARGGLGLPSRTIPFPMYASGGFIGRYDRGGGPDILDAPPPPVAGLDPSGQDMAGSSNDIGLPLGWENMEDPTGRHWAGAGVQPQGYNFGPPYDESSRPYSGGPSMNPPVWTGPANDGGRGGGPSSSRAPGGWLDYSGGNGMPSNWQDFSGRDSSTGGGFYTIEDLYTARGQDVPHAFQAGSSLPSTNNYRMLPPGYQQPNFIMRNGFIINMNDSNLRGPQGGATHWASGAGMGFPAANPIGILGGNAASVGWPGSMGGWAALGPATTSKRGGVVKRGW